jgi:outer membrane immunogenic protein
MKSIAMAAALVSFVATAASAADMPVKAPPKPVMSCNWCGFYVGANAGNSWSHDPMSTVSTPVPDGVLGLPAGVSAGLAALSTTSVPLGRSDGFIGGVQAGYNWQTGNFVSGLEADIQDMSSTGGSGSTSQTAVVVAVPVTSTQSGAASVSWLGTLRGRLGLLVQPNWLLYATGGLAYGEVKASDSLVQVGTNGYVGTGFGSLSTVRTGWTLGAGTEWLLAPKWSIKAEYLHYDLGTASFNSAPTSTFLLPVFQNNVTSVRFHGDIARVGLNYHL